MPGRQPLATIRFDTDSRTVDHRGHRALLRLARRLAPSAKLSIEGHADQRGDERYNEWLGLQRARAVRRLLRRAGIDRDGLLPPVTWGSRSPRSRESGPSAWAQNRRVEVFDVADEGSR